MVVMKHVYSAPLLSNSQMSSARHTVTPGPSLSGLGKRPVLTPAHHVDLDTGMGPRGARMEERGRNPAWGSGAAFEIVADLAWRDDKANPTEIKTPLDEFGIAIAEFGNRVRDQSRRDRNAQRIRSAISEWCLRPYSYRAVPMRPE